MEEKNAPLFGPLEIERKFLVETPDMAWLMARPGVRRAQIVQTYLKRTPQEEVRVRRRVEAGEASYVRTVKRAVSGCTREEIEEAISRETYEALLESAGAACPSIEKTRCCFPFDGHTLEIDVYPFWNDRAILEIELGEEREAVRLPEQIRVIREVTDDPEYKNAALAAKLKR